MVRVQKSGTQDGMSLDYGLGNWYFDKLPIMQMFSQREEMLRLATKLFKNCLIAWDKFDAQVQQGGSGWKDSPGVDWEDDDIAAMISSIGNYGDADGMQNRDLKEPYILKAYKQKWLFRLKAAYKGVADFYKYKDAELVKNYELIIGACYDNNEPEFDSLMDKILIKAPGFKHSRIKSVFDFKRIDWSKYKRSKRFEL